MIPDLDFGKPVSMLIFIWSSLSPKEIFVTYFSIFNIHHGYHLNKHFQIFEGMHFVKVNLLPGSHIGQGVAGKLKANWMLESKLRRKWFQPIILLISKLLENRRVLFH